MSGLLLEKHEKERFADYLRVRVDSYNGIVEQMKKLGVPPALVKREKTEIAAMLIVIDILTSGETTNP